VRVAIPGVTASYPGSHKTPLHGTAGTVPLPAGLVAETSDVVVVLDGSEGAFAGCPASLTGNLSLRAFQIRVCGPGKESQAENVGYTICYVAGVQNANRGGKIGRKVS